MEFDSNTPPPETGKYEATALITGEAPADMETEVAVKAGVENMKKPKSTLPPVEEEMVGVKAVEVKIKEVEEEDREKLTMGITEHFSPSINLFRIDGILLVKDIPGERHFIPDFLLVTDIPISISSLTDLAPT